MSWNAKTALLVLAAIALCLVASLPSAAMTPQNPTPPPDPSGGGNCPYCSDPTCGCPPPPPGCIGRFVCTCSPIQCTQQCSVC